MKKIVILSVTALMVMACGNNNTQKTENAQQTETEKPIGGETDKHGCLTAAGETWSELQQKCLRLFDQAKRLNPINVTGNEAVISSFILFNEDKTKAEIFLPNDSENVILNKIDENLYENGIYKYNAETETLSIDAKEMYKAEK